MVCGENKIQDLKRKYPSFVAEHRPARLVGGAAGLHLQGGCLIAMGALLPEAQNLMAGGWCRAGLQGLPADPTWSTSTAPRCPGTHGSHLPSLWRVEEPF